MSTLNELAYNVLSSVRPHLSDDEDISLEKIKFDILSERATLIRNELNKNRTIDDSILTYLDCEELVDADRSSCPELPLECYIKRTKNKIPNAIELHNGRAVQRISNFDILGEQYNLVEYNHAVHAGNRRFNKETVYAFFRDGYIYFKSGSDLNRFLKRINISLVLEDPTVELNGESCYDPTTPFPMNKWMETYVLNKLKEIYLKVDAQALVDKAGDADSEMTNKQ